jgi:two-component system, NarL family, sensor histidine kinase EvgS
VSLLQKNGPLAFRHRVKRASHLNGIAHFVSFWFFFFGATFSLLGIEAEPAAGSTLSITAAEQAWIKAHPVVRVGYDADWPPFSFEKATGELSGIDADVLQLLSNRLGIKFEAVRGADWTETYARAKRGEIDILAGTARTPEREQSFHFTTPYQSFPAGIITRGDQPFLWSVYDLEGKTVAGPRNYVTMTELAREYPEVHLLYTANVADALVLVADRKADAAITNLANASFVIKTQGLSSLKIAGIMPEIFDLRYGVRQDWPELVGLLDKGIATITRADLQALNHRWVRVDYARVIRWDLVWKTSAIVLTVLASVIAFFVWHNRSLTRELAERIRLQKEVERAHFELTRINDDRSALLQMAAHDLRGPLTGMQLVVDSSLRLRSVPGEEALQLIEGQVKQMALLLNDILDLEAIETGRRELRLAPVDAGKVLASVLAPIRAEAARKKIEVTTSGFDQFVAVQADEMAMRQIVTNLLSNAVKFTQLNGTIRLLLSREGNEVQLQVCDDGPGVPVTEREKIFTKYVRGSAKPTAGEKSTGLGLSIVRSLAEAMRGQVWCEEPPSGRGAVFVLVLPAAEAVMIEVA